MGLLKGCAKLVGSAVLGVTGVASSVVRACVSGAGMDELADMVGKLEDKSFEAIENMWTPDEEKNDEYYERQAQKRREIEKMKEKAGK